MKRSLAAALLLARLLAADGTTPKQRPSEYTAQATVSSLSIAADYWVRTFGGAGRTFYTNDYLVVEVALYSAAREPATVSTGRFTLRINGKKPALFAQSPGMLAASLKYPDWERRPHLEATAGVGGIDVTAGRPRPTERFPGDPSVSSTRLPRPPKAPEPENPSGEGPAPQAKPEEIAVESALPEGERVLPVSGYLYFAYKGALSKIRTVELVYQGAEGGATLRLK
ncbi:MAG: hypothetical protein HYR60_19305 [Acidobacteria bacterium]|nr:hypothetical protein [Acidobacteriota bacterium]